MNPKPTNKKKRKVTAKVKKPIAYNPVSSLIEKHIDDIPARSPILAKACEDTMATQQQAKKTAKDILDRVLTETKVEKETKREPVLTREQIDGILDRAALKPTLRSDESTEKISLYDHIYAWYLNRWIGFSIWLSDLSRKVEAFVSFKMLGVHFGNFDRWQKLAGIVDDTNTRDKSSPPSELDPDLAPRMQRLAGIIETPSDKSAKTLRALDRRMIQNTAKEIVVTKETAKLKDDEILFIGGKDGDKLSVGKKSSILTQTQSPESKTL